MKRELFDMEACIAERKTRRPAIASHTESKLGATIHIAGAPTDLSKFRTRVVLNECISGKPLEKAVERAMSITDKRHTK